MRERDILAALNSVLGDKPGIAVIHSSLFPLRAEGGEEALKWPLLGALSHLAAEGWTLALPTFTFSFCRGEAFDIRRSASETGLLGQWLLTLGGAIRSPHPIYSFALLGPRAAEIAALPNTTTFGADSSFAFFEKEKARLVMLGCPWSVSTQLHRTEEEVEVPYRAMKDFEGEADLGKGARKTSARMFVRDLEVGAVNDFTPAVEALRAGGKITTAPLAEGTVEATSCRDLGAACRKLLKADPLAFVRDKAVVAHRLTQREARQASPPLKIALLGTANLEILKTALAGSLAELLPDRRVEIHLPPYGQAARELLDPGSDLAAFGPDLIVFADRLEDLCGTDLEEADVEAPLERQLELIHGAAERLSARLLVLGFGRTAETSLKLADRESSAKVAEANRRLTQALDALPNAFLIDLEAVLAGARATRPFDPRLWHIGRFPFSQDFSEVLARRLAGAVLALQGRTARLLAIDLDNTLWGGVLGEDGLEGLQLGGDWPGNAFLALQKTLKRLKERGVALAIVSKNDEADALAAMKTLPAMLIGEEDLAGWRIDWNDKPSNLAALAEEIGLGLESIAFLDDNPAERERMRLSLPQVKVIELPDDPARYAECLLESPFLECLTLTAEDRKRAEQYARQRAMKAESRRFTRPEDFYAHLAPSLFIQPLDSTNVARAEQLCAKTNQFNTTARRYDAAALRRLQTQGQGVYVIATEDRFTARENIGLAVVLWNPEGERETAVIDLILLSCRVLGRGLESGLVAWIAAEAKRRGFKTLAGEILELPRNAPVRGLYRDHGFKKQGADRWVLDLTKEAGLPPLPAWVSLHDRTRESADAA